MKTITALLCLLLACTTQASEPEDINLGAYIINAKTQAVAYQQHPTRSFLPASNLKLFVAVAALQQLTPTFQYLTTLSQKDEDYYLQFSGDPSLSDRDLYHLLDQLPRTIHGHLILDNTVFDHQHHARGTTWDELNVCYSAPTSSISLDGNCRRFTVSAGKKNTAVTSTAPHNQGFQLKISAISSTTPGCKLALSSSAMNDYLLTGCLAPNTTLPFAIAIHSPDHYAKSLIHQYLQTHHITVDQGVQFGRAPRAAHRIASHASQPLNVLVAHMLKTSDNHYANALLKTLGHHYFHQQGSWFNGLQAIRVILKEAHIDFSQVDMHDAAGQSRYNLVTPQQIVALLNYAYHSPTLWPSFKNALAISATDGTLKHRLGSLKGSVFAKTGNLKGTNALSGYLVTKDNTYIFSLLINGGRQDSSIYWATERHLLMPLH